MSDIDRPPPGWCPECDGPSRCAPGTCCGVGAPEAARDLHEALDDLQGLAHRLGFCCYAAALAPNGPCPWHAEAPANEDLIERCARAAHRAYFGNYPIRGWDEIDGHHRRSWLATARAVLSEASTPPPAAPAPITAEDVRAAVDGWNHFTPAEQHLWNDEHGNGVAAFVADYLNRRGGDQ